MDEWNSDFEQAPKDGTRVYLAVDEARIVGYWDGSAWVHGDNPAKVVEPAYWASMNGSRTVYPIPGVIIE